MKRIVAAATMKAKHGQRDDLIALLNELAVGIRAEPGCIQYAIHRALSDDDQVLVIQSFVSLDAFKNHSVNVRAQIPRLAAMLDGSLTPPVLFESVDS